MFVRYSNEGIQGRPVVEESREGDLYRKEYDDNELYVKASGKIISFI